VTENLKSKALQVFINGRFLSQSFTGVQRYAYELVKALDRLFEEGVIDSSRYSFCLLIPPNAKENVLSLRNIRIKKIGNYTGQIWEQIELPFHARSGFLVGFCNTGPLFKKNQIVTFCDASVYRVPEAYSILFRMWYRLLFTVIGRRARGLLTISDFSRNELVACCGIQAKKITVTYPGIDHHGWSEKQETNCTGSTHSVSRPFILAVSSMSPHKNFCALVEAVALLGETDFDVLIAGGTNPAIFQGADIPLPATVKHVGYVSDAELKSLYSQASCFIYPSLYEGFGLPPLEAMSNGCPVIVAHAGSLPEVCGDAALYCDPKSPQDIANKITEMMGDPQLRESLRDKGFKQIKKYTWQKCAHETLSVIQKVFNK